MDDYPEELRDAVEEMKDIQSRFAEFCELAGGEFEGGRPGLAPGYTERVVATGTCKWNRGPVPLELRTFTERRADGSRRQVLRASRVGGDEVVAVTLAGRDAGRYSITHASVECRGPSSSRHTATTEDDPDHDWNAATCVTLARKLSLKSSATRDGGTELLSHGLEAE